MILQSISNNSKIFVKIVLNLSSFFFYPFSVFFLFRSAKIKMKKNWKTVTVNL